MHGKMPQDCIPTVIVPTCKNNNGDICDAGNYKPVCPATTKLFEQYILPCNSPFVAITDNQLGFKPQHGTSVCIFLLKQTMPYHVNKEAQRLQLSWLRLRQACTTQKAQRSKIST